MPEEMRGVFARWQRVLEFWDRVREGKVCLGLHVSSGSTRIVEMVGYLGLDFVIIGTEVESFSESELESLIRTAFAAGSVPMVKVRYPDVTLVNDALVAGAPCVMVPHITSRAQLDEMLAATRFSDIGGNRGFCPTAGYSAYGLVSYSMLKQQLPTENFIVPIIEDKEALDRLDEIFSAPDVLLYEIGPYDLSISLGIKSDLLCCNPDLMSAIETIAAAAKKHNKKLMSPHFVAPEAKTAEEVIEFQKRELLARGVSVHYHFTDMLVLGQALSKMMPLRDLTL